MNAFAIALAIATVTAGTALAGPQSKPVTPIQLAQHNHHCHDHPDECGRVCVTHDGHRCRTRLRPVGSNCHCHVHGDSEEGHVVQGHHHHHDD